MSITISEEVRVCRIQESCRRCGCRQVGRASTRARMSSSLSARSARVVAPLEALEAFPKSLFNRFGQRLTRLACNASRQTSVSLFLMLSAIASIIIYKLHPVYKY